MTYDPQPPEAVPGSVPERLALIQTLNNLPSPEFDTLVGALKPPGGIVPPYGAAQGTRTAALLAWVEGSTGPGMSQLQVALDQILNPPKAPTANALLLEWHQDQLNDLVQNFQSVTEQLRGLLDVSAQKTLERKIQQISQQIAAKEQEIERYQADRDRQTAEAALDALRGILTCDDTQLDTLTQAYRQTIRHWPVPVQPAPQTVNGILNELARISPGSSAYTAQDEFIAHVVQQTTSPTLADRLTQWGQKYRSGIDWLQLDAQIQAAQVARLAQAQPAILMTITRSDQATTQAKEGETFYQLNAWLIEDVATYTTRKTGYHSLVSPGSLEAQPCVLEALLANISQRLNEFLAENQRICERCENYPQVHVFLPLELMHLGVDVWPLAPENRRRLDYLGHNHEVVIRCANRYDRNYKKAPSWYRLWRRHQTLLQAPTQHVFVAGHDTDLDALRDHLDQVVQPESADSSIVGLQVTQAPVDPQELCYELLDSGLPLAIWPRCNLANGAHETQLHTILQTGCLSRLPHTVKAKRYETRNRQNSPDCHIGHHLSLVWDDPYLVPPKSA